ncbi:MAG: 50S ribosomal protein L18 [Bacteroidales bacterium]|jgi:large subunit ribosomal protein L18|nr:50S ribosomal protein L18 [Bacteroidales bacterium]MDD2560266.1 50S ribosomal protein L18 [Bacteroidales bacterium]MDD2618080.1 50S ribosomal protein L18 [Bacteroidales bacterium]MDD4362340.1 50S ribosomal protein L18 [Bacteroidales bacterium]MDD4430348.1 50S ribosomal protein L18 [Bacteroidales bacterium]
MTTKELRRLKIKQRVRSKSFGTSASPRMTVFRSNKQIYVQFVDDKDGKTLASASSLKLETKTGKKEQAVKVGEMAAKNAIEAGITTVVFDRNGYLYHGRIKELADAARKGGLKF